MNEKRLGREKRLVLESLGLLAGGCSLLLGGVFLGALWLAFYGQSIIFVGGVVRGVWPWYFVVPLPCIIILGVILWRWFRSGRDGYLQLSREWRAENFPEENET